MQEEEELKPEEKETKQEKETKESPENIEPPVPGIKYKHEPDAENIMPVENGPGTL